MSLATSMFAVYEILNETLKEIFVGITDLPLEELQRQQEKAFPPLISHWRLGSNAIRYRLVEGNFHRDDARHFSKGYVGSFHKLGWKMLLERNGEDK